MLQLLLLSIWILEKNISIQIWSSEYQIYLKPFNYFSSEQYFAVNNGQARFFYYLIYKPSHCNFPESKKNKINF